ncbi:MFS transporter [bacterium]|nr:MFS transporter [bacterium]
MQQKKLIRVLISLFIALLGFATMTPILSMYARDAGASVGLIGLLLGVYPLVDLVIAPVTGRISDRVGRKPVILVSLLGFIGGWLVLAIAENPLLFLCSQLLAGFGSSQITITHAYIADVTLPEKRTRGMGFFGMTFALAFIIGPPLGGLLSTYGSMYPPLAAASFAALSFIFTVIALPEPIEIKQREHVKHLGLRTGFRPVVMALIVFYFIVVFTESQINAFFAIFSEDAFSWGRREVGMTFGLIGLIGAILQGVFMGRLVRRFGRKALVRMGLGFLGCGLLLIGSSSIVGISLQMTILFSGVSSAAIGFALCLPVLSSLVSVETRPELQGKILGVLMSFSSLGRMFAPVIGGVVYQQISPAAPFWLGGILALAAVIPAHRLVYALKNPAVEG